MIKSADVFYEKVLSEYLELERWFYLLFSIRLSGQPNIYGRGRVKPDLRTFPNWLPPDEREEANLKLKRLGRCSKQISLSEYIAINSRVITYH